MNIFAAWLIVLTYLAFAYAPWQAVLAHLNRRLGDWTPGLFLLPYLLAVNLRPAPEDLLRFAIYLALPTVCLRLRPRQANAFDLFHILAILFIWIPVETDLFLLILDLIVPKVDLGAQFSTFYLLPQIEAMLVPGLNLPIQTLTAVLLTLFLFLVSHPVKEIGFSFRLGWRDLGYALVGLLAFIVIGLPVGLGTGFLDYNPVTPAPLKIIIEIVLGYLLIALVEELLFRGIIQNLLARRLKSERMGLLIASIIFGLAHLNNAKLNFPTPNWTYALIAALAGLTYGWVWMRTKKVTVSAITHTLVNLIWSAIFHV